MNEAPSVTARVLPTANAIAALTGKRPRTLPFDHATLKA
jgi:CO/xanthine dehydrogenase Mo-binding subunit